MLYRATLLPGVDFGDTGSFQATVGSREISPRDGYPLYFAIGNVVAAAAGGDPARALNLTSAIEGGAAAGLLTLAAAELSGSVAGSAAAALLFAGSYTFWSQSIIAEVYALHACFVSLTLLLLLRWNRRQRMAALATFFGVYALGFGNHLSMVLLLPAYAVFLLTSSSGGWRTMLRPSVVALAVGIAALGSLQYAWNLRELWRTPHPPSGIADALQAFWFDVTKSDWRETMVAHVPSSMVTDRLRMFAFDCRQQFGVVVPAVAGAGLLWIWRASWQVGLLLALMYLGNALFAFGYNVGDTHVFLLPAHLVVAVLAAPGLVAVSSWLRFRHAGAVVTATALAFAAARIYSNYPALDRSSDVRPTRVLEALTAGLDANNSIFLTDLNWQIQNGLSCYTKNVRPDLADARVNDVLLYAPTLIRDNLSIGRDVALTDRAATTIAETYGPLFDVVPDGRVASAPVSEIVRALPKGTRYVLTVLKPSRDLALDERDLDRTYRALGISTPLQRQDYFAAAGLTGSPPAFSASGDRPFAQNVDLDGVPVEVRMESWLGFDTIRRMGFGQAIAKRTHALIVERGVSFAAFNADGKPLVTAYASNIFAPQRRYMVARPGT